MVFTHGARCTNYIPLTHGAVAQLIERFVRNEEVVGLIPICSTMRLPAPLPYSSVRRAKTILPADDGSTLMISTMTIPPM